MTVLWNGVPLQEVALQPSSDTTRLAIHVPNRRVDPGVNRLQVQAALQIRNEDCVEANPARTLTIFNTTDVRYGYRDREPIALPINPDLARYPAPFYTQSDPQPATVRVVVPPNPSSSELTAAVRVVAQLGQFASEGRSMRHIYVLLLPNVGDLIGQQRDVAWSQSGDCRFAGLRHTRKQEGSSIPDGAGRVQ